MIRKIPSLRWSRRHPRKTDDYRDRSAKVPARWNVPKGSLLTCSSSEPTFPAGIQYTAFTGFGQASSLVIESDRVAGTLDGLPARWTSIRGCDLGSEKFEVWGREQNNRQAQNTDHKRAVLTNRGPASSPSQGIVLRDIHLLRDERATMRLWSNTIICYRGKTIRDKQPRHLAFLLLHRFVRSTAVKNGCVTKSSAPDSNQSKDQLRGGARTRRSKS